MDETELRLIEEFDITVLQKTVYQYKGHKYDNLKDAVNFAKIDMKRINESKNQ